MGTEILIVPLAGLALLVLGAAAVVAFTTQRTFVKGACALLWFGALLVLAINYAPAKTFTQNIVLALFVCGLLAVVGFPVLVVGSLVALPFKKCFAHKPDGPKDSSQ